MADPRPWLEHYPPGVPRDIDVDAFPSIVAMFEQACARHPRRPAYSSFGVALTWAELDRQSAAFAAFLANEWKLGKGDRLAIMLPNLLQYPIALFGALRAGLTVVNVNPLYTARELQHQLEDSGAKSIVVLENFVAEPMFNLKLFRIRAFTWGNLAGLLASIGRGGLQFMLIIWLQGIWLPLHGYSFESTQLWTGIYMLPITVGFLIAGPLSGILSDRWGARGFASGGLLLVTVTFVLYLMLPVNFPYWQFAIISFLSGIGSGMFGAPNRTAIMNSVPAKERGAASGVTGTLQNAGSSLSIGVFFSLMIIGLAGTLPTALRTGLLAHGVPTGAADQIANLPPVGSLFAAFLGYNPIQSLLGPAGVLDKLNPADASALTGTEFFPNLISGPFHSGLVVVFLVAAAMSLIGAVASLSRGKRFVHEEVVVAEANRVLDEAAAGEPALAVAAECGESGTAAGTTKAGDQA